MNEEEKKALKVINARTRRLLDELEIEKEDMSDEPKIAYLMQEIRANKTILNLIEKLQKENEELNKYTIHLTDEQYKTVIDLAQNDINQQWIQKVKDKIEEYKKMLLSCNSFSDVDRIKAINERILELQELLEGRK